jgi:CPA2 family monovalent cation:H+ antiporter-2
MFRKLSLPAILGYLIVGTLIGPNALALVANTEDKRYLAEFGVVFLMFSVGLEFSLPQLVSMRKVVFGLGGLQIAITMAIGAGLALAAGLTWQSAIVLGGVATGLFASGRRLR